MDIELFILNLPTTSPDLDNHSDVLLIDIQVSDPTVMVEQFPFSIPLPDLDKIDLDFALSFDRRLPSNPIFEEASLARRSFLPCASLTFPNPIQVFNPIKELLMRFRLGHQHKAQTFLLKQLHERLMRIEIIPADDHLHLRMLASEPLDQTLAGIQFAILLIFPIGVADFFGIDREYLVRACFDQGRRHYRVRVMRLAILISLFQTASLLDFRPIEVEPVLLR